MKNKAAKQISIIVFLAIALFATAFFVASLNVSIANADDDQYIFIPYAGELKDLSGANPSSYVFIDENMNFTFKLTQTYYLKYLATETKLNKEYYKVSYCGLEGYVAKDAKLQPQKIDGVTAANYAPNVVLVLTEGNSLIVGLNEYTSDYAFRYLGESENGKICVLCEKDGTKKVVETDKSNFNAYAVPLHQVTQAAKDKLSSGEESQMPDGSLKPKTETNKTLRGLLIAGIVVPAVIIIILIFIPRRKNKRTTRLPHHDQIHAIQDALCATVTIMKRITTTTTIIVTTMAITKKVRLKEITETEIIDATVIAITVTATDEATTIRAAIAVTTAIKQVLSLKQN